MQNYYAFFRGNIENSIRILLSKQNLDSNKDELLWLFNLVDQNMSKCEVCADTIGASPSYGAITCPSCRVFFRRQSIGKRGLGICFTHGNCEITKITRNNCQFCRYQKCLKMGKQFATKEGCNLHLRFVSSYGLNQVYRYRNA